MPEPKRPGRPPIGDREHPAASVHVRVHPDQYDHVYKTSQREGISVPEILRRGLKRYLDDDDE
jgi:hypothetical protein